MTRGFRCAALLSAVAAANCGRPAPPPPAASEVTDFRVLFSNNCAGCHGADGRSGPAPPLNNALYLRIVPREELERTIANGRPGTSMPAFARDQGGSLYPKQITALVDGMEKNWATPVSGPAPPPYRASGGDAKAGAQVFQGACAPCHGAKGAVGPLINQSYLALASDQSIRAAVIIGRPQLGMPDWRHQSYHGGLSDADVSDVVAYIASQRSPLAQLQQQSEAGPEQLETGPGRNGEQTKGNEGSGNGPGSPRETSSEGNAGSGGSSIQAGPGASEKNTQPEKHQ